MGQLTHAQLVTEATELAGNTGLATRAQTWLGMILRELFEKSPLPLLFGGDMSSLPITPSTIAAGVQTLSANTASAGVTTPESRSVRRVWLCTNGQTDFTRLTVEHPTTMEMPPRAYTGVSGVAAGRPQRVICINTVHVTTGVRDVTLYFDPIPDKTYAVWVITEGVELAYATYSAGQVNKYPSDLTVTQGIYALCLKHQADERFGIEWKEFLRMAKEDRATGMRNSGANTRMQLSSRSFASRGAKRNPADWMGPK